MKSKFPQTSNACIIGENDPFISQLLQRFAEKSGLQAINVSTSQNVLALARQVKPVAIIIDAELPGEIKGWEVVRKLRAEPDLPNIPIISCSWLNKTQVRNLMGKVSGHLNKPELRYEDFVSAIQNIGVTIRTPANKQKKEIQSKS